MNTVKQVRVAASKMAAEAKKRRQHHVWQHYLKAWATDGQLFCLRQGRIFLTNTANVAVERDFYKLQKLTPGDVALIRLLVIDVENIHPSTKANHENFLNMLITPTLFEGKTVEVDSLIDTFRTNALENYHAGIEASFQPMLECALNEDLGFYDDDTSCIALFHYLGTQYMRTKGIKTKTIELIQEKNGADLSRIWDIMSHMFSVNVSSSLYLERKKRKLTLLKNQTDVSFVTGDQPVINLSSDGSIPVTQFSLYYPISPRLALILCEVDEEPPLRTEDLTPAQVLELNARMQAVSYEQMFGDSEMSLFASRDIASK